MLCGSATARSMAPVFAIEAYVRAAIESMANVMTVAMQPLHVISARLPWLPASLVVCWLRIREPLGATGTAPCVCILPAEAIARAWTTVERVAEQIEIVLLASFVQRGWMASARVDAAAFELGVAVRVSRLDRRADWDSGLLLVDDLDLVRRACGGQVRCCPFEGDGDIVGAGVESWSGTGGWHLSDLVRGHLEIFKRGKHYQ